MTPELVTVGGLTVDNVIAADGTVGLGGAGGNGAYSAVGALIWCERVGLVSLRVRSYPHAVLDRLEHAGIDLAGVRTIEADLRLCNWFIYDAEGRRREGLRSTPEALAEAGFPAGRLSPAHVAAWRARLEAMSVPPEHSYSDFRDLHPLRPSQVPGYFLAARGVHLAPSRPVVLHGMLGLFGGRGMAVTLDAGWQLASETLDAIAPMLAQVDAFLPSEVELEALVPGAELGEALAQVARHCRGTVAVKLGPRGCLVWDRARAVPVAVPAVPVEARDPTGAGDSFCGGFLAGLVETGDAVKAACFGTVAASVIVTRFGVDGVLPPAGAAHGTADRSAARETLARLMERL